MRGYNILTIATSKDWPAKPSSAATIWYHPPTREKYLADRGNILWGGRPFPLVFDHLFPLQTSEESSGEERGLAEEAETRSEELATNVHDEHTEDGEASSEDDEGPIEVQQTSSAELEVEVDDASDENREGQEEESVDGAARGYAEPDATRDVEDEAESFD
ncbi:MAG: hypothetical protein Q9196_000071 [Gyalolechia fulgens]